jgi:thiol:disulfide interchange protein DsbC
MMLKKIILVAAIFVCGAALADEASVKKLVETKLGSKVTSVTKTPYSGLYEVFDDKLLYYTDENVSFMIYGMIINTETNQNVTEARMRKLGALDMKLLPPLDMAIKRVKGDGKRVLRVFSDPMCPFCKRLETELARVNNVTIYIYPYALESKFPGTTALAKSIWCAGDRAKAWEDWMLKGARPPEKTDCANPVAEINNFAATVKFTGTPTLVFADGAVVPQFVSAADIERFLNDTPR